MKSDLHEECSDAPRGSHGLRASSGAIAVTIAPDAPRPHLDLEHVYEHYSDFVFRVCRQLGVPQHAAEDVTHDVFMVVARRLEEFEGRGTLRSWLYGVTRRVVMHYHRGRTRAARRLRVVPHHPTSNQAASEPRSDDRDPESAVQARQMRTVVWSLLEAIPAAKREPFVMSDLEGMTAPEIAEALELKINTVYSRIRAGRKAFERAVVRWHERERRR